MIGQSGLPTMNSLAGSKDKAPEDAPAKSTASKAGAFEKAFMPEASVDGQQTPSKPLDGFSPVDARTGGGMIAPQQTGAAQFGEPQFMAPAGGTSLTSGDFEQQVVQPIAGMPNRSQDPGVSEQVPSTRTEDVGAELQAPESEAQSSEREALMENEGRLASSATGGLDAAGASLNQRNIASGQAGSGPDTSKLTLSPNHPEVAIPSTEAKATKADLPANGTESRSSLQVLHASTALSPSQGSDGADARRNNAIADLNQAPSKAEAHGSLATAQTSEKNIQSQVELAQLRSTGSQPLGELRSAAASAGASLQPGSASMSSNNTASAPETGELRPAVLSPAQPVLSIASEASFLALGSLGERAEALSGGAATVTSTASSRYDAPATTLPPIDARQVVQQINQAIIRMDGARTEVMLDPVELGRVNLTFITKDEGVTVLISADRSETADLLRRNGEQLQRDLSNAGYEGVELDFGEGGDPNQDPTGADRLDDTAAIGATTVSYDANLVTSGLDIRI